MLTGVDRVEKAWLSRLIGEPLPAFGLIRTAAGYLLLDRAGMAGFARLLDRQDWGLPDILSRMALRLSPPRQAAESRARALACARCLPPGLGGMLRRHLPAGFAYFNIGHSNLTERVLSAMAALPGTRITVLVHDTIPLDHPDWQREGTVEAFAAKLSRVSRHADRVIATTHAARADLERHFAALGRRPGIAVAPLGLSPVTPDPAALPSGLRFDPPVFLCLGTIEPRKDHALLLDVWQMLPRGAAQLVICGSRGWRSDAVLARLDARPPDVIELAGLPDAAVAAIMRRARALVFPSRAEGFGLPLAEAAAAGLPILCSDLPVCREVLGSAGIYLEPANAYAWAQNVRAAIDTPPPPPAFEPPTWEAHFKVALSTGW